ncbi:cytochrome c oxidase subunit 3 [Thermoflavifilum thermophilum]|uniref:Cytochrome c oxidase subunit 3 n=1 Tax=Thermoflavifilum thermophilum TaxID=1393122 RepID=A0A1I7NCU9_9BACT|nr:cytochrome c oxidase subunit 3 [Thermoflavifilum thermophilum]SFV32376.1 cytochrome c oxidase subunit 3 [Thermoflavifilum thermophilum]
MAYTVRVQRKKIHPYKFNMWVAIAAIVMMFGGLTSAYVVMHGQSRWVSFQLPHQFIFSTTIILLSSLTMALAVKSFRQHQMNRYKMLITITAALGVVFMISQFMGFRFLYAHGVNLTFNVSASLLFIITGLHMLHVLGGVIALLVMFFRAFRSRVRSYDPVPVEVAATYWHFVDILWIYLFGFFIWMR